MVLGISSFTYGWNVGIDGATPKQPMHELNLLDKVNAFGLTCLQLGDNLPVHAFSEERKETFKNLLQKHSIRLELGARKLTSAHLQKYILLCSYFNTPLLRFVMDADRYEPNTQTVINILKDFEPMLRAHNVTLGIENHDRLKAKELASIMDSVGSPAVGICLDCVNSMGAGEGLEHVLEVLAPYTVNLHIKDFTVQRLSHKMGFSITGVPTGKGMVNVPVLLEKLKKYNRCQSAILEQWVPFKDTIEQTIATEEKWAIESIGYLNTISAFNFKHEIKNIL
jgi:3-oxoisoapionate decarboxylase